MAEKKITKAENFTTIKNILEELGKTELAKVMEHEIDLITKKSGKVDEAKASADKALKDIITEVLGSIGSGTVTQIIQADSRLSTTTNQKITSLLRQMVADNLVINTKEKKVSIFTLA